MSDRKKIALTALITAIVTVIITCGILPVARNVAYMLFFSDTDEAFYKKIEAVNGIIDKKYLYEYDKSKLRENALKAYIDGLDEPYTEYYTPSEFSALIDNLQDGYVGIGIVVGVNDDNQIQVIAPFEGSPAYNAGVLPGDILTAVEDISYDGDTLTEAVDVIKNGKEGTSVNLTFLRDGKELKITVERSDISSESVKSEMLDGNIGYIRITSFNIESTNGEHSTASEFKAKLQELQNDGADRLIIDLRDNPGGVLPAVCAVADALLPEGVITYTEEKNGKRNYYNSDEEFVDIPIVTLINRNSASAAELLAGALKDYGKAVIVGERSYGKGVAQDVFPFLDGSGLVITTAQYFTPNGISVQGTGVEPDVTVETPERFINQYASMIARNDDIQLKKAIEIIKEK